MKYRFIAIGLFGFVWSATLSAQTTLSNQEIKNVNATADVTVNATLRPAPPTFRLTGNITGTTAFFVAVTARSTDGLSVFSGSVDPTMNNYLVKVPAGTYQLSVAYLAALSGGPNISTFQDPVPVQVSADTVRDIVVTPTLTHRVSGTISPLDSRFSQVSVIFGPKDLTTASAFAFAGLATLKADGAYTVQLSDGVFSVILFLSNADASRATTVVLGSVTVNGADVAADFTVPGLANLSGTVLMADMSPVPKGSAVLGIDGNPFLIRNTTGVPLLSFGSATIDGASGAYQLTLTTGHTYTLGVDLALPPEDQPQSGGNFTVLLQTNTQLNGDSTQDIMVPQIPGTVVISGQVTDGTGAPLANVSIDASTAEVSGVSMGAFSRITMTDANGNYRLVVLSGTNYDLKFTAPVGTAASPFFSNDPLPESANWMRRVQSLAWMLQPGNVGQIKDAATLAKIASSFQSGVSDPNPYAASIAQVQFQRAQAINPGLPATVSPSSGSNSAQAFAFTYTDPNGYQDISGSQIVINSTTSGAGACYILFGRGNNAIALADDAGTPGPLTTMGAPTVLQNSQCSVLASNTSQTFSGNTITLNLFVAFKPAFAGAKKVNTVFSTVGGVSSGLQLVGTFTATVNKVPISARSVTVVTAAGTTTAAGTGRAQTFTFNYFDPNGYPNTSGTQVLFSRTTSPIGACYILFGRGTNQIALADDTGSNFSLAPLGGQTILQNSQCSVFAANSYQSGSAQNLFLTLFISFAPSFTGAKNIYSGSVDNSGTRSAFPQLGSWTVPATLPPFAVLSVTPSPASSPGGTAATGPSNSLTFVFSHPGSSMDIAGGQVVVNRTLSTGAGSCYIQFARSGLIALVGDDGLSPTTANLGQPTTLQNSQCVVNAAASYLSGSGNYLSLTLFLTMKTAGMKNVFASASTNAGEMTGFPLLGTWNVTFPAVLMPLSVSPGTGAGPAGTPQFFTFTYAAPLAATDISGSQIIINPALQGAFSCYILYGRGTNVVAIANDTASSFTNGTLGTAGTLQSSQCSVDLSNSFQTQTGSIINLTLAVTFKPAYKGLMYAFSNVVNNAGNASSFPALGTFTVQ